jgi:hypothetical protein
MSKLFQLENHEEKCGGCNWPVTNLYALADSQEEAEALYQSGDAGLCGDCMCEMIVEQGWEVKVEESGNV